MGLAAEQAKAGYPVTALLLAREGPPDRFVERHLSAVVQMSRCESGPCCGLRMMSFGHRRQRLRVPGEEGRVIHGDDLSDHLSRLDRSDLTYRACQ